MTNGNASNADKFWEIERIAQRYEADLKQADFGDSIEAILASKPHLPRRELLKALIETELDVLGTAATSPEDYCRRFPDATELVRSIFHSPLDTSRPPVSAGQQVGDYRIERLLGKGAVGYVYHAVGVQNQTSVAIKILRPDRNNVPGRDYATLFRHEARIGGSLNHPRIVKLIDRGEHASLPYHVFEFVDGWTLREFRGRRLLEPAVAARIVAQVAAAIGYSHQRGVVHRDLKPSNILISRAGEAYVTDFGIALDDFEQGTGARVAGTPQYMSPEQLSGDSHLVDGRSDIYSLGVILYEAVTGVHPTLGNASSADAQQEAIATKAATPVRQRIKVSPAFERICLRALAKQPSDRFSSALDLSRALKRYALIDRIKRSAPIAAAVLIVLAGVSSVWWLNSSREIHEPLADAQRVARNEEVRIEPSPAAAPTVPPLSSNAQPVEAQSAEHQTGSVEPVEPLSLEPLLNKGLTNLSLGEAHRAARLIIARLREKAHLHDHLWSYYSAASDNTLQTALIHLSAVEGLASRVLMERLASETDASVRSALVLALGGYTLEQISQLEREKLLPDLMRAYCIDPDSGIHGAVAWLLRHWGFIEQLEYADQRLFSSQPHADFEWYMALPDIAMIVCQPPLVSAGQEAPKFAISTGEVTMLQWDWNMGQLDRTPDGPTGKLPKNFLSWHNCAEFCNRLSKRTGLPSSEYCYEQLSDNYYRAFPDAIHRRGFRMPTVAEWTLAAQAGTSTRRYWGRDDSYLPQYANCRPHSRSKRVVSGTLKPNRLGLFDMLGNVSTWNHDSPEAKELNSVLADFPIRGGSAWTVPAKIHVDAEYTLKASEQGERMGLRLVQSLIPIPRSGDEPYVELRSNSQLSIPGIAHSADNSIANGIPLASSIALSAKTQVFVGRWQRGDEANHHLFIENSLAEPLSLTQLAVSGCLEATTALQAETVVAPGASVTIPLRIKQSTTGTRKGRVAIRSSVAGGQTQDSNYDVVGFISGPAVAAIEDPLDATDSIALDYGSVRRGTAVRHVISLLNVGDQKLAVSDVTTTGAVRLRNSPGSTELIGAALGFFEIEVATTQPGAHKGRIEIATSDPLSPVVCIDAKITVAELAKVPVLALFRDGLWLLDYNHDGRSDVNIEFGKSGDQPLAGDFNGDGIAQLAVVRHGPNGHLELHIRSLNESVESEDIREFEETTGQILVGDFDGDSKCDVAWVSFSADSDLLSWQIDTNGDNRWDQQISFGFADDIPVVGDWNGDGRAEVGTVRRSQSLNAWFLSGIGTQNSTREVHYGLPGDLPVAADWNGDGLTDIGVFRFTQGAGSFLLDLDYDPASERFVRAGIAGDIPVAFMTSSAPDVGPSTIQP